MLSMLAKDLDSQHFHHLINNIELCNTYTENFFIKKIISVVKTHLQCNHCPWRIFYIFCVVAILNVELFGLKINCETASQAYQLIYP